MAKYQVKLKVKNCVINGEEIKEGFIYKDIEADNPDEVLDGVRREIKSACEQQDMPMLKYKVLKVFRVKDE